ncbi:MAG: hypothetical protein J1F42_13000 [Lachnospiraceae bacterium]|nr:hypothetical protein [Lachnospiraceae bacterium]
MFEIIVFIIIGVAIYKKIQSAKENSNSKSLPNTTVTTANQTMPQTSAPPKSTPRSNPAQPMVQSRPSQPVQHKPNQPVRQHDPAQTAIQEAKEDGNTTTAYLMEKAEADAREHAREKFEEQKRLHETRGGLAVAERYLDGDTVPQGKRIVNCGYCGAENLMPMMPRTKYSCYFCREPL